MSKDNRAPDRPVKHPVAARVALVATAALVGAILTGLAKGLASLK